MVPPGVYLLTDKAVLRGFCYVPLHVIGDGNAVAHLKKELTFTPRKLAPDHNPGPVEMFDDTVEGWLGVPRYWGRQTYSHLPMVSRMAEGSEIVAAPKRPDPNHERVLNPAAQNKFMKDLDEAFRSYDDIQAIAATGSGKTVCSLNAAANHGRSTLILVPWEHLAHQWMDEIMLHLGTPRERIGLVQGPTCQWRDKDFAVGIYNSVAQREYMPEFYSAFGTVIVDEAHKVNTEFFSPALSKMHARKRLTLTATQERKDGGHLVIERHVGPIRVTSEAEALPGKVWVDHYDCGGYRLWGANANQRVACLSRDLRRNQRIVGHIVKAFEKGRHFMVISFSVDHLETLMAMCEKRGVPRDKMGLFTGEKTVMVNGKPHMVKDRRTNKMKPKRKKVSRHELEQVKKNAQVFFTTYGKFKEGGDVPRLDSGIDATPQSEATQVVGRIRRPVPGKKEPLWITMHDVKCDRSKRWYQSRCKDYLATGMEIVNG